jgi:hypothetical protein
MASGIIYLLIVGMWVAYFVPRWVHSHDEFSGKSVERYKSALKTVASSGGEHANFGGATHAEQDYESRVAQILMRRRIVFGILTVTLLFTAVESLLGSVPFVYSLVPVTGLVLYVAHVRRQSVADRMQKRRVTEIHKSTAGISTTNLAQVIATHESKDLKENLDHWVPLVERELSGVVILPKGTAPARNSWQPNEVPLPTYVNAPKAVVPKRTIDLTIPGAWLEEQERLAQEAVAAGAPTRDEVFDQQLAEETVERLRQNRAASQ